MSHLLLSLLSFLLHAFVLKVAVGAMGAPDHKNTYSKALWVAFGLNVAGFVLGWFGIMGAIIYLVLWFAVIMSTYTLGFLRSTGVAIVQVVLKFALGIVLSLLGLEIALLG